jgi:hypothetical protein
MIIKILTHLATLAIVSAVPPSHDQLHSSFQRSSLSPQLGSLTGIGIYLIQ